MIAVRTAVSAVDRMGAIHRCADVLEQIQAVRPAYRAAMVARELAMSSYMGAGVAIPHGELGDDLVRRDALAVLRFPGGIDWAGHRVIVCVAIAAHEDSQLDLLTTLAAILLDPDRSAVLRAAEDPEEVMRLFC
jgi:PTS system mannitol-specific IIA component